MALGHSSAQVTDAVYAERGHGKVAEIMRQVGCPVLDGVHRRAYTFKIFEGVRMSYRDQKSALRAITAIAASQGGYFTARQAKEAGYAYSHLSYHLSAGNFERAGRGLYRIPTLPHSEHDDLVRLRFWSRGRDDEPQAVVSHQTALVLHDLAEFIPTRIHLTVPPSFRKPPPEGCTLHKAALGGKDAQEVESLRVTTPLRTLHDLADDPSLPTEQFERAVKEASSRGMIRRSQADDLLSIREAITATARSGSRRA